MLLGFLRDFNHRGNNLINRGRKLSFQGDLNHVKTKIALSKVFRL